MIELRELRAEDVLELPRIYSQDAVGYLDRGPMGEDEATLYVHDAVASARARPRARYVFGIETEDGLVGVIKLNRTHGEATVSYIVRSDCWGRGHASEAVTNLLALAFTELRLPSVHAKHHPDNHASGRVLTKAGFTRAGSTRGFAVYIIRPSG
ncbi:ribosomal-protein-alanine N-acetyltransferase [Kitasatospora sp. MAA4]|uniref:GNAT family N-acetyltransferase n=1 Tax=Kitasatospora sp. MAA4 TaxID=3035093 RepID=UPI002474DDF7|nr:GNAT family N-acetyltransferase [Kitasatospora sp. MAA4]MDH6131028.1 ribosomal-protein-alanine N-acetyltransferase [Kitasatospora sp. MAA4]